MRISISSPIPDLGSKPGPGRPGWGPAGSYDFQFEVTGAVTIRANAAGTGNFRVKWPNGTTQVLSGNNASIPAPDGIPGIVSINNEKLDDTYCDEFAVVGGQTNVTKVLSWGQNPWNIMNNAFSGCTSLSDISTTKFIADSGANIIKMFNGCTSLLEADIKNWDLSAGVSWYGGSPFSGLVNLQKLDMTGMIIKLTARSDNAFSSIGSATTNGCEFLMSNIDWSTTTSSGIYTVYWFTSAKFKDESNLSGWTFPSVGWNGTGMFSSARVIGNNAVLDVSGWTTYSGYLFPSFTSFNSGLGNTGAKIDMSNMGLSNITSMSTTFQGTSISKIIGLSTWGATAGNVNMFRTFWDSSQLSFSNDDNFSNTFITSLTPSNFNQTFMSVGVSAPNGKAPNITNIDFSGTSALSQSFSAARFTNVPDLASATFSSSPTSFNQIFNGFRASDANSHLDFSNTTFKPSSFNAAFNGSHIDKVTFGNNVDFSSLTTVTNMFYYPGTPLEVKFPTNADFSSLASTGNWFAGLVGPTTGPLTTCQIDNLIRRFRATAYGSALNVKFYQGQITEAPSVVRAQEAELVANGWIIDESSTDATMPFVYTGSFLINTNITPTINTSGGTFSSSDVTVNEDTGTFNSSTAVNATIRYTFPDGCYNEQVLNVVPPFTPFKFRVTGPISIKAQPAVAGQSFTIDWGDGSTPVSTTGGTSIASNFTTAGTYDVQINAQSDATYCDEFAIVSGQTNVTNVLDWGENPWTTLSSAFLNCTNLTDISTTSLTTGVGCVLSSAFKSCTSLADVNISSWDMTNAAVIDEMFRLCTGLEVFQASSLHVDGGSRWWLRDTGTAVTDGCEYKFNGLNITSTSFGAGNMTQWWLNMKINPSSSFANISWPSIAHSGASFQGSSITGVNSTLDCSGWTNYNSTIFPSFHSFTATEGGTSNMKIDITNLNVSSVISFNRSFISNNVSEIIGLNNLGASAGITNMEYAFVSATYLKFTNYNFSSAFINSFNLGSNNFIQAFKSCGSSLALADAGVPPNLHSLDLSSVTTLLGAFNGAKFSTTPDFSNVTMSPTTAYNFSSAFAGMQVNDSSNVNSLFSKTFKVSSFNSTFFPSAIPSIIIGNGVDFSSCTTMTRMFQSATATDVQLPTNMDLGSMTGVNSFQYMLLNGPTLSTCQVDNFIRRLNATALTNGLAIDFKNGALTESPAVVQSLKDELVSNGWSITTNTTDATLPFVYPSYSFDSEVTQSVTPTTIPTGGVFSTSTAGVTVDASTGVVSWSNTFLGIPIIRCTYTDGCYNEVEMLVISTVDNNYSMEFSSTGEYFDTGTSISNELGSSVSNMTLSVWINITPSATNKGIFAFNSGITANNVGAFSLRAVTDSRIQAYFSSSSVSRSYNIPSPGGWHHVAIVKEGTTAKCFIDGNEIAADTSPGSIPSTLNLSGLFGFIGLYWTPSFNFDGNIDELAVFNTALSSNEVKLIHLGTSTNKSLNLDNLPTAPVAWYRMGD